jgi:molecular chaperone HtpG
MGNTAETHEFQAETRELLRLMIHSLYKNREIFLRELISNASDALDKLRFAALTKPQLMEGDERLGIRLEPDPGARTLTVIDTGIGMDRDEVVANLGTIARSGTRSFLEHVKRDASATASGLPELIGQFGVGFYSAFMVADEVVVETRKAGDVAGVRWRSKGDGTFTIEAAGGLARGTRITLHLKPQPEDEDDPQDFTQEWTLRTVVKRHSDFIAYPIELEVERKEGEREVITLNSMKPLWTRPPAEVTAQEHTEFYRHLAHAMDEPLESIHFRAEGTSEYTALMYLPTKRAPTLFEPEKPRSRLALYVKRVLIMAECEELLPPWLRFVRGLVDSADLPLNVSRETLQHARQLKPIRSRLTKRVVDALAKLLESDREKYASFFAEFGATLKEGIYADDDLRQDVAKICLFTTTKDKTPSTLHEIIERLPVKQRELYYVSGESRAALERLPVLEAATKKGFEVLLLVDAVDEFALARLESFDGKPLRPLDKGTIDLEDDDEKKEREEKESELKELPDAIKSALGAQPTPISAVRFTNRLDSSPAAVVYGEHDLSPHLVRRMREAHQDVPDATVVLELNPRHALIQALDQRRSADEAGFRDACELLLGQALLARGEPLADPSRFNELLVKLMLTSR